MDFVERRPLIASIFYCLKKVFHLACNNDIGWHWYAVVMQHRSQLILFNRSERYLETESHYFLACLVKTSSRHFFMNLIQEVSPYWVARQNQSRTDFIRPSPHPPPTSLSQLFLSHCRPPS